MCENLDLKKETLLSARDYIKRVIPGIDSICDKFREDNKDSAFQMCSDLKEGLEWLAEAFSLTKDVQEACNVIIGQDGMTLLITKMESALETKDTTMMGGFLTDDLKPVIFSWEKKLDELVENRLFA
ncbi:MAG: hypothetical protein N3I35_11500 [Clostridia bacterium]|nr:hypothetical protein [Clostridia bacterium]